MELINHSSVTMGIIIVIDQSCNNGENIWNYSRGPYTNSEYTLRQLLRHAEDACQEYLGLYQIDTKSLTLVGDSAVLPFRDTVRTCTHTVICSPRRCVQGTYRTRSHFATT
jgi:hypothetical protein